MTQSHSPAVPNVLRVLVSGLFSLCCSDLVVLIGSAFSSLILSSVSSIFLSQNIQVFLISVPPSRRAVCPAGLNASWVPSLWAPGSRSQGPGSVVRCWEDRLSLARHPPQDQAGLRGHWVVMGPQLLSRTCGGPRGCPPGMLSPAPRDADRLPASPGVAGGRLMSAQACRTVPLHGFVSQTQAVPRTTRTRSGGGDRRRTSC